MMATTSTSVEISVDNERVIGPLDERIYSSFTEHMGRCIYGGLYEPGPLADDQGFRKDVLEAMRELDPPIVRYPGGNFVSNYHWMDGIGPKETRPKRLELAWLNTEPNTFGTDEFMSWLKELGSQAEPYICLNMGSGTMEEAMYWVEYLNGRGDSHYAELRRKHGHPEPYNVKYIGLGNEIWGPWQIGQLSAIEYAQKARRWAKAIKLIDPDIKLVSCGKEGNDEWDWIVLRELVDLVDFHSIHMYSKSSLYEPFYVADPNSPSHHMAGVLAPLAAEKAITIVDSLIDLACLQKQSKNRPKIAFDEWNVWDPVLAPGEEGAEMHYNMTDALAVSTFLNVFIRQSQKVAMANIAQAVNVIAPIMTNSNGLFKQTSFYVLKLYRDFMKGEVLEVHVSSPTYDGPTYPSWLGRMADLRYIDAVACKNGTKLVLAVSNRHESEPYAIGLKGSSLAQGLKGTRYYLTGKPDAKNDFGKEEVSIQKEDITLSESIEISPCTLSIYVLEA